MTLTCGSDVRTTSIERGTFELGDVPTGRCRVAIALDGMSSPPERDLTIRKGELVEIRLKLDPKAATNDAFEWQTH